MIITDYLLNTLNLLSIYIPTYKETSIQHKYLHST